MDRQRIIVRAGILGVIVNILLAAFKAAVGLISNSIAIVLDAVNNLTDALSAVITIIGARIAGKKPDKKHPLGHGRAEYLTAASIAVIILYAGMTSLLESGKKILHPQTPEYGTASLVVVAVAVLVKIALSRYVKKVGLQVNSDALLASGEDARNDAYISTATLLAAGAYLLFQIRLEAWLGVLISLVILRSGSEMIRRTVSLILGERIDEDLARNIKKTVLQFEPVLGAYDLILHSYGPDRLIGSVHIEVADTMTVAALDQLERDIADRVIEEHGVILTGISIYSVNTTDDRVAHVREDIRRRVMSHDHVLQMHGFHMHDDEIRLDVVIGFDAEDGRALFTRICEEIRLAYPDYRVFITMDSDVSD